MDSPSRFRSLWSRRVHPEPPEIVRLVTLLHEYATQLSTLSRARIVTVPGDVHINLLRLEMSGIVLNNEDASDVGAALRQFPSLRLLDLRDCCMQPRGVLALATHMARSRLRSLSQLLLGGNWTEADSEMSVRCITAVSEALVAAGAHALETLSLSNGMLPQGAVALCNALALLHPPLTHLDVSDSRFGYGGAAALLKCHQRAPFNKLSSLDLFACHIGPRGGDVIGRLLASPISGSPPLALRVLCLADNAIQDRGLAALATALRTNAILAATLEELDVSSNGIGLEDDSSLVLAHGTSACEDFAHALAAANVASAPGGGGLALRRLNISQNFIHDGGMHAFASALEAVPHLEWLDISCCNVNDVGLRSLAQHFNGPGSPQLQTLGTYNQGRAVTDGAARALLLALRAGAPQLTALHAGRLNMDGSGEGSAGAAAVSLVEARPLLRYVDLRDNTRLDAELGARLDACCAKRQQLQVHRPDEAWPEQESNDIFSAMEGWHQDGLVESRQMWCRWSQTVWFYRGEDHGGEHDQPVYVIEEPGGELNHVASGMPHAEEEV